MFGNAKQLKSQVELTYSCKLVLECRKSSRNVVLY